MTNFLIKAWYWLASLFQKKAIAEDPKQEQILEPVKAIETISPQAGALKAVASSWFLIAQKEVGIVETPGPKNNPKILKYHQATTLKATADEVPWCSSFVSWCLEESKHKSTKSAWARSYLNWGKKLDKPVLGCIVVFSRGDNSGHVGFFVSQTSTSILVLGGNQDDQVKYKYYPKARLLGYRWPI